MDKLPSIPGLSNIDLKNPALLDQILSSASPAYLRNMAAVFARMAFEFQQEGKPTFAYRKAYAFSLELERRAAALDNKGNNGGGKLEDNNNEKDIEFEISLKNPETVSMIVREALKNAGAPAYVLQCERFVIPTRQSVGGIRHIEPDTGKVSGLRWNLAHLAHCSNVWLCPDCRSYIVTGRALEISRAFDRWTSADPKNCCWMLTLTAQHKRELPAAQMVEKLKAAYDSFRHCSAFDDLWRACPGPLGTAAVIGNYEFTFGPGGTHPHRHMLFFMKGDPSEFTARLKKTWVRCCERVGLYAVTDAVDFHRVDHSAQYISKIGFELCNSGYTKEASRGRYDYIGLCNQAVRRSPWAMAALRDYIKASRGLRALHWSKGLKAHFEVTEKSDDEVIREVETLRVFYISRASFESMGDRRGELLVAFDEAGGKTNFDLFELCCTLNVDLYDPAGNILLDAGADSPEFRRRLPYEIKRELELENGKREARATLDGGGKEEGAADAESSVASEADGKTSFGGFGGSVQLDNELGVGPECSNHADLQALLFDVPCTTHHPDRE